MRNSNNSNAWVKKAEEDYDHDLLELLKLVLPVEPLLQGLEEALQNLNPYAAAFRYPGEEATIKEAKEAVKVMKYLRNLLRERLGLRKKK